MRPSFRGAAGWGALLLWTAVACGDEGLGPDAGATALTAEFVNLAPLDPATEGRYEAWVVDEAGAVRSLGTFTTTSRSRQALSFTSPVSNPSEFYVTVEPPEDADPDPADGQIVGGWFEGRRVAELSYISRLTPGVPFIEKPGTHVLFTPSDNSAVGYPSNEDAGIWLFEFGNDPEDDGAFWLDFAPADRGWIYEGWMVFDYGLPTEVWFSYGKFNADSDQKASSRDDSGLGPFSGRLNYKEDMPEEIVMPGDDWVANPHGYPVPGGLPLPLDLNGCTDVLDDDGTVLLPCPEIWRGPSRFTHVITLEPIRDLGEDHWLARPFFLEIYRNAVGEGSPVVKRTLEFQPQNLPSGTVTLGGGG